MYQAYCTTCSWVSRSYSRKSDAYQDAEWHEIEMGHVEPTDVHHRTEVRRAVRR